MEQLPVLKKLSELDNFQDFRGYRPPVCTRRGICPCFETGNAIMAEDINTFKKNRSCVVELQLGEHALCAQTKYNTQ